MREWMARQMEANEHDVLLNHVGGEELKSIDGVGTGRMKKKEKSDNDVPKEPNKEWKMNEKVVMEEDAWR
ncbi:hypothetical protein Tco_0296731 [Tanacetum coccineum]